jgi:alpha/beta hydrolase family protein
MERYESKAGYMARVSEAVEDQVEEGLLLPDDAATILTQETARNIGLP